MGAAGARHAGSCQAHPGVRATRPGSWQGRLQTQPLTATGKAGPGRLGTGGRLPHEHHAPPLGGVSFTAPDPDPAGRRGTPRQPPPHPGWAEPGELLSQHLWPLQWARAGIGLGSGLRSLKKRHTKGLRGGDGWPFSRPLPPRAAAAQAELTPTRATEGHGRSRRLPSAEHSWRVGETDVGTPGSWAAWWGVDHEGEGLGPCAPGSSRLLGGHPITCLTPCAPFWWPCSFDPRRLP